MIPNPYLISVAIAGLAIGAFMVGRLVGAQDERLRVLHAFDVALCIVSSGALHTVRRCIRGELTIAEMRLAFASAADRKATQVLERGPHR